MQRKVISSAIALSLAALMIGTATPVAKAALPAPMSWVKYSGNPVVTSATCGVPVPFDPAVIWVSTDNYRMYFSSHPSVAGPRIFMATTSDGGQTWTCANSNTAVLPLGAAGAWDETRVINPTIIKDGSTYKMWYTGRNALGVSAIGYAESTDPNGIIWTKVGGTQLGTGGPAAWDSQYVRNPSVVKSDGTYHMWYEGTAMWPYFKIGHATSLDGISWTKDPAKPVLTPTAGTWDAIGVSNPYVVTNGSGVFEMFYSGNSGGSWLTGHATSSNGTDWTKDANAIIAPSGGSAWDKGDSTDYAAALLDGTTWKLFYSGAGAASYQIGMATLTASPQLTFRQMASAIGVSGSVDVYVDLTAVTDLYGYQFMVNYDATKVSASAAFDNSIFNTGKGLIVPAWDAKCAAGVCKFAVTMDAHNGGAAVSGSGPLAKITFTGVAAGLLPITFSDDILSKEGAIVIAHSTTTGWLQVNGSAMVSGKVSLQGRDTPKDAGTVTVFDFYGYVLPTTVPFDPATGIWTAVVPIGQSTAFTLLASHGLYLNNQSATKTFVSGGNYPQPDTMLRGGDANNSGKVEVGDLTCVGGDFGTANNTCSDGNSDINKDLIVNILDLVLVGGNYDRSSPQGW